MDKRGAKMGPKKGQITQIAKFENGVEFSGFLWSNRLMTVSERSFRSTSGLKGASRGHRGV